MSHRLIIDLTLTVRSPFIMPGLDAGALGVDAAALRNETGRPLIPADQVKGVLRAACVTLVNATKGGANATKDGVVTLTEVDTLFGRPSPKRDESDLEQDVPARGALIFDDLVAEGALKNGAITRVHIDPVTGAARTGHLQTVELVAPLGMAVTFTGRVIARIEPAKLPRAGGDPADWMAGLLDKAIKLVPAIGGLKSAGFGQVTGASATLRQNETRELVWPQPRDSVTVQRHYHVTFDRRLLVDAERLANNVWQGQAVIPGAVFKGALAERLKQAGERPEALDDPVGRALAAVRITHAFPSDGDHQRLMELPLLPLSLFVADAGGTPLKFADALMGGTPDQAPRFRGHVPTFQFDWKDKHHAAARETLKLGKDDRPASLPRAHVAIGKDYVAESGKLYVDVARSHLVAGNPARLRRWHLNIHCGSADADIFRRFLTLLETEGLDGIGATGAHASFQVDDHPVPRPGRFGPVNNGLNQWAVTLATPAMMLDPLDLQGYPPPKTLHEAYTAYWAEALGTEAPGAELVNFYARQRLTGGYIAVRRRLYGRSYYPFLLTEPGSVFLLKGDLGSRLEMLMATGLPAKRIRRPDGQPIALSWRNCSYLPENGYGEILVNAIDHAALAEGVSHE